MSDSVLCDPCMQIDVSTDEGKIELTVRQQEDGQGMTARLTVAQAWRLRQIIKEQIGDLE